MLNIISNQGNVNESCAILLHIQLQWLKLKILKVQNIGQDVQEIEFPHIANKIQNGTAIFRKDLMTYYKVKHTNYPMTQRLYS